MTKPDTIFITGTSDDDLLPEPAALIRLAMDLPRGVLATATFTLDLPELTRETLDVYVATFEAAMVAGCTSLAGDLLTRIGPDLGRSLVDRLRATGTEIGTYRAGGRDVFYLRPPQDLDLTDSKSFVGAMQWLARWRYANPDDARIDRVDELLADLGPRFWAENIGDGDRLALSELVAAVASDAPPLQVVGGSAELRGQRAAPKPDPIAADAFAALDQDARDSRMKVLTQGPRVSGVGVLRERLRLLRPGTTISLATVLRIMGWASTVNVDTDYDARNRASGWARAAIRKGSLVRVSRGVYATPGVFPASESAVG